MKKLPRQTSKGFTLIEMLITLVILVAVMGASLLAINPVAQFEKSRDTKRKAHLEDYRIGIEAYSVVNEGQYPDDTTDSLDRRASNYLYWSGTGDLVPFMSDFPTDPKDDPSVNDPTAPYVYRYMSSADLYDAALFTALERAENTLWVICTSGKSGEVAVADVTSQSTRVLGVETYCGFDN